MELNEPLEALNEKVCPTNPQARFSPPLGCCCASEPQTQTIMRRRVLPFLQALNPMTCCSLLFRIIIPHNSSSADVCHEAG